MLCFQIDLEDTFDPDKLIFYPEPHDDKPCNLPSIKEDVRPAPKLNIPVNVEKKKVKTVTVVSKTLFSVILDFCLFWFTVEFTVLLEFLNVSLQ